MKRDQGRRAGGRTRGRCSSKRSATRRRPPGYRGPSEEDGEDLFHRSANPAAYVPREATEAVLETMREAVESFAEHPILFAPPGFGKTLLLHVLADRLGDRWQHAYLPYPLVPPAELCRWALLSLGQSVSAAPEDDLLRRAEHAQVQGGVLLLIDDADYLPIETARRVVELSRASEGRLRLVFAATEERRAETLLRELDYELHEIVCDTPLSADEALAYLREKTAGLGPRAIEQLPARTLYAIWQESEGIPAAIDTAAASLLRRAQVIGPGRRGPGRAPADRRETVRHLRRRLEERQDRAPRSRRSALFRFALGTLSGALIGIGVLGLVDPGIVDRVRDRWAGSVPSLPDLLPPVSSAPGIVDPVADPAAPEVLEPADPALPEVLEPAAMLPGAVAESHPVDGREADAPDGAGLDPVTADRQALLRMLEHAAQRLAGPSEAEPGPTLEATAEASQAEAARAARPDGSGPGSEMLPGEGDPLEAVLPDGDPLEAALPDGDPLEAALPDGGPVEAALPDLAAPAQEAPGTAERSKAGAAESADSAEAVDEAPQPAEGTARREAGAGDGNSSVDSAEETSEAEDAREAGLAIDGELETAVELPEIAPLPLVRKTDGRGAVPASRAP